MEEWDGVVGTMMVYVWRSGMVRGDDEGGLCVARSAFDVHPYRPLGAKVSNVTFRFFYGVVDWNGDGRKHLPLVPKVAF